MIPACTTKARAASDTAAVTTIRKISSVIVASDLADRVAVGLLARFHRVVQRFLLPSEGLLATVDPTRRGILELAPTLLNVVRALPRLALNVLASFGARLRRE